MKNDCFYDWLGICRKSNKMTETKLNKCLISNILLPNYSCKSNNSEIV
jgi:hypothetical protein